MTLSPPPAGGPQFIAGSKPHGTLGLGEDYANLTGQITGSFGFLTAKAVFRATQITSAQTLTAGLNAVHLNNIQEDPYSGWDGTNFWWLPPAGLSGWFLCTGCVFTAAPAGTNSVAGIINTNGPGDFAGAVTSNPAVSHASGRPVMAVVYLPGGENYVQLQAYLAGADLNTSVTVGQNSHLEVCFISN